MPFSVIVEERRSQSASTELVDDALSLAEECGWRYALAYLISERVPSQVIQRLLSGGARIRKTAIPADIAFPSRSYGWSERNSEEMQRLYAALRLRRHLIPRTSAQAPFASRGSKPPVTDD